jgi:hypothetical protein
MRAELRTVNLCLPGACLTAFVRTDKDLGEAVDYIARKYETHTGRELEPAELAALRRRLEEGMNR